ncbi:ATP-binding cassette domain-containing protein [Aliidiomarina maris]|uniref:Phospholipid ABC transporter ATP-binding protein MlaF n=1 Tax=Aliidiomarina maris TaxID=531312 RepID=A0A327X0N5_9GAMM|nr:ATP-binding cassette domain-containing protein [Aliidiomarina maris]MBA3987611.1 phospholipid ABC transporter ATP-binding protein MlaF [Idiomarina sp.]MCL5051394.1 ATP-binding cassette domain-containing protein [Bacillota bacterium]RAJ99259.1 phospholipid/cholesterol/gamma-HCH transport system ATP-binding protein [Aliidiomarina maris]RUO27598.1 phospholipid ABC transporter ATP-binding protein MlaF [Aliidiomarina maris]
MDNLVELQDVHFYRGNTPIYQGVNLRVPRGKITAIMGPSGCGKTTMLRLIGGQLKPRSGSVQFAGQEVPSLSRKELFELRKRMSMLFQSGALFTDMTVNQNVAFPIHEHTELPREIVDTIVKMKLQAVGLRGAGQLFPSELSGGMARRAALARSIALDPELIMYDEPFTGQDPISMGMIVKLIRSLNETLGLTSIVVSHDIHETMGIADHVAIIANKQVVAQGSPSELLNHESALVRQFLNGEPDGPVPFHYQANDYLEDLMVRKG